MAAVNMKPFFHILIRLGMVIGIIIACCILVLAILLTYKMPWNEYQLRILQKKFRSVVNTNAATRSNLLAEFAEVDHWGNSNLCDYYVGQFRSSPLPRETLERAYFNLAIPSFSQDENNPLKLEIYFINDNFFEYYPWSDLLKQYLPNYSLANQNIYLVWTSSDSHSPDGDIRCH